MNIAPIPKIFDVLKSWLFALSLGNNVSTLCRVCALQNVTSLKSLLNLLNKYGLGSLISRYFELVRWVNVLGHRIRWLILITPSMKANCTNFEANRSPPCSKQSQPQVFQRDGVA